MKKLLLVLAVSGAFAACGNKSSSDADKKDTTQTTAPMQDTSKMKSDTGAAKMSTDTSKMK